MSSYREQGLKAKEIRLGIIDVRGTMGKNKRPKLVILESRSMPAERYPLGFRDWSKWGAYRTQEEAEQAMAQLSRKYSFYEYRIKP